MHSYKKLSLGFPFSPGFSNFQVPGLLDFSVPGLPRKKGRTEIKEKEKKIGKKKDFFAFFLRTHGKVFVNSKVLVFKIYYENLIITVRIFNILSS